MTDISNAKYNDMRRRRLQLSRVITDLKDVIDQETTNKVLAAFLYYEGAVLQVLQEDINTIDELIGRVERTEGANNG